jgi:hypothetical protein
LEEEIADVLTLKALAPCLAAHFAHNLAHYRTDGRGELFNFDHLSRDISSLFEDVTPQWSLMKRAGNFATRAISIRCIIATDASHSKRDLACKESTDASFTNDL